MMTSSKPYLIKAMYQWIVDNEMTPHIVVNAKIPGVQVPAQHIEEGRVVLNISPAACRGLHLENDRIIFSAKFSGVAMQIFVPPLAVMAVYAKENGRGMVFNEDDVEEDPPPSGGSHTTTLAGHSNRGKSKPQLKVVK